MGSKINLSCSADIILGYRIIIKIGCIMYIGNNNYSNIVCLDIRVKNSHLLFLAP